MTAVSLRSRQMRDVPTSLYILEDSVPAKLLLTQTAKVSISPLVSFAALILFRVLLTRLTYLISVNVRN
jgi:hypothetical protein